jgi:glutamate--cysteine ligase
VALDYSSEADFINKYQYACLLLPLLSFISSNSPVFEGQENSNPLIRTVIWRGVDSARSCIVPTTFAADFSFARYAEYIIDQAAIFEMKDGKAEKSERKVDEVLAAKTEWDEDFLLYLSLVFPDVRLRQYIEIRIADAMDEERTFAYMALIKGLFSDAAALGDWLADVPRSITAITAAQDAIMKDGMQAQVYGRPVKLLLEEMMGLAARQLTDCGERERLAVL